MIEELRIPEETRARPVSRQWRTSTVRQPAALVLVRYKLLAADGAVMALGDHSGIYPPAVVHPADRGGPQAAAGKLETWAGVVATTP